MKRTRSGWETGFNPNSIGHGIYFEVDMQDLMEIENGLNMTKDKTKQVLKAAINKTATDTNKLIMKEVYKRYQVTEKVKVKRGIDVTKKATISSLEAVITSKGKVNELYNFKVSPRVYVRGGGVPGGYKGKVLKKRGRNRRVELMPGGDGDTYKAFIVRYASGHMAVAQRVPGKKSKKTYKEAIKSLFSPSIPTMVGYQEGVFGIVEPKMYDLLDKHIQAQILRYLG